MMDKNKRRGERKWKCCWLRNIQKIQDDDDDDNAFLQKYLGSWTHRDLAGAKTLKTVKKKNQNEYNNDRQPFRIQEQLNRNFDNSAAPVFELEPKYFEIKYKNTNKTVLVWKNPEQILLQFNGKKKANKYKSGI